ncbi:MAG TPA: STAS domain-containing protein [Mycobacteriales bacterium]|nr:STAS domain-containing protein [Mycobacteriales bacterium]
MWWRGPGRRAKPDSPSTTTPVVLAVTEPLTGATAERLSGEIGRLDQGTPVVIDLTAIPSFDSDGAAKLAGLQDRWGADHLTIVGLRQATARITGAAQQTSQPTTLASGWTVRRLRNLAVVQASETGADPDALEGSLSEAIEQDVAIVVCDLRGTLLSDAGASALAFASSAAAVRGQELLVVNVPSADVGRLRGLGLSATTYVAPET